MKDCLGVDNFLYFLKMKISQEQFEALLKTAKIARERAFCPYSRFSVGSALLTKSGKIFAGCNVENVSLGLTICAERVAIFKAVSEGEGDFLAIAVFAPRIVPPCGACLQVLSQFVSSPEEFLVISSDEEGKIQEWTLAELFPSPFHFL